MAGYIVDTDSEPDTDSDDFTTVIPLRNLPIGVK